MNELLDQIRQGLRAALYMCESAPRRLLLTRPAARPRQAPTGESDAWLSKPASRETRIAELCKLYLRLKYEDRLHLVEQFIREVEEDRSLSEGDGWEKMIDLESETDEELKPLDEAFEKWLGT